MILDLTYGYIIKEEGQDPLVDLADKVSEFSSNIRQISRATLQALAQFSEVTTTGAYLIDMIPWLKYIPAWMPGAGFKTTSVTYKKTCDELGEKPLSWLKQQIVCTLLGLFVDLTTTDFPSLGKRRS